MNKILSISIASYNVEASLKETLDSLIIDQETLKKLEVFIVNDGSKDKTSEIAMEYCAKYPDSFFLINKQNGGYGSTINAALKAATGKYFRLLDGDDWYFTEKLQSYLAFLESTDADLVVTPYVEFYEDIKTEKLWDRHLLEPLKVQELENLNFSELKDLKMHELASKTSMMKEHGIRITEHCFYTDTEYAFLNFFYAETIAKYEKPIYRYRIGRAGQSVSIEGRVKHSQDAERVLDKITALYEAEKRELTGVKKKILWDTIKMNAIFQYTTYLLLEPNQENKENIKRYDKKLKKIDTDLYREVKKESKAIRILRMTHYVGYRFVRSVMISRMNTHD